MLQNNGFIQSALYVLKHKDLDVAMVQIDRVTGKIEYVLEIYLSEELPVGCENGKEIPPVRLDFSANIPCLFGKGIIMPFGKVTCS